MLFIFRILEKLLIVYFVLYLLIDISLFIYSFIVFTRKRWLSTAEIKESDWSEHPVSIIVPAHNEAVSIIHCTEMLLRLDYSRYEVIVVNDGSSDKTLDHLLRHFNTTNIDPPSGRLALTTERVRQIYVAANHSLTILDKENGGKADAINAGINVAKGRYVCTIDADSILDNQALKYVVKPFIDDQRTMVTGGQLAPSNDMVLENNQVVSARTPTNIWVLWQIIEYIKSFMVSRIGLSRINGLLIMSGAFAMFRRDELLQVGGFLSYKNDHPFIKENLGAGKQTLCEDMEIVVRLFKFRYQQKKKAKAVFLPGPVCWTEVPENGSSLFKQRERWHQGLVETLMMHRSMIFEPGYKATGMIGMPYYMFFEMLAPLIKVTALFFIIVAAYLNLLNVQWLLLLIIVIMLLTAIISGGITAIVEFWSSGQSKTNRDTLRYKNSKEWSMLILAGIVGEFTYSFFKFAAQLKGMFNFVRKKSAWKRFDRKGIKDVSQRAK
ncbi:MAG: glycosyltransferase [Bacteroidales bacterium]